MDNCQAMSGEKIYNHVNYAMKVVNVAKAVIRQGIEKEQPCNCSIQDNKRELLNHFYWKEYLISMMLSQSCMKIINYNPLRG